MHYVTGPDAMRAGRGTVENFALTIPPLNLADDFYLLVHHDVSGAPTLNQSALGFGLVAGLLAELLLTGWAAVDPVDEFDRHGVLTAVDRREPAPADFARRPTRQGKLSLHHALWNTMVLEPFRLPLRAWLTMLSATARDQVAERLVEAGHLRRSRRGKHLEPTDWNLAGGPASRLWAHLHYRDRPGGELPPVHDVALLALADAAGLGGTVLAGHDAQDPYARAFYSHQLASLAQHRPALADLIAQTRTAVASAVITR